MFTSNCLQFPCNGFNLKTPEFANYSNLDENHYHASNLAYLTSTANWHFQVFVYVKSPVRCSMHICFPGSWVWVQGYSTYVVFLAIRIKPEMWHFPKIELYKQLFTTPGLDKKISIWKFQTLQTIWTLISIMRMAQLLLTANH